MLESRGIEFDYRDYRRDPLSESELRELLAKLELSARELLRTRDAVYRELALSGDEPEDVLIGHLAAHPTLLQRPIGVRGDAAVVGRPIEKLLELV